MVSSISGLQPSTIKSKKLGFGGGCHWCTEAVFQALKGVSKVEQGYISSTNKNDSFSEAVIVHFDYTRIPLEVLIEIHLLTHKSTSNHSFRNTYRSAIYYLEDGIVEDLEHIINELQPEFDNSIITKILPFKEFKPSREQIQNYYKKNPNKPFCEKYISPKLELLKDKFQKHTL